MTALPRLVRIAWPIGLLLGFFGAVHAVPRPAGSNLEASDCGLVTSSDAARLERCLALHPDDVETMADLGAAYERAGRAERAEAVYRRALAIETHAADIHVRLGEVLLARGDAEAARREGAAALGAQPGSLAARELVRRASTPAAGGGR